MEREINPRSRNQDGHHCGQLEVSPTKDLLMGSIKYIPGGKDHVVTLGSRAAGQHPRPLTWAHDGKNEQIPFPRTQAGGQGKLADGGLCTLGQPRAALSVCPYRGGCHGNVRPPLDWPGGLEMSARGFGVSKDPVILASNQDLNGIRRCQTPDLASCFYPRGKCSTG